MKSFYAVTITRAGGCESLIYSGLHSVRLALAALGSSRHPERRRGVTVTIKRNGATVATLTGSGIRDIFTAPGVDELAERARDLDQRKQETTRKTRGKRFWRY